MPVSIVGLIYYHVDLRPHLTIYLDKQSRTKHVPQILVKLRLLPTIEHCLERLNEVNCVIRLKFNMVICLNPVILNK